VNGKAPSFDFDAVFALQRKNVEAFTAANQLAFDGVKAVAQRQAEIARKAFEEFGKVTKELTAAGTPEDKFAKQADLAKSAFEEALANMREVADTPQKSQSEAARTRPSALSPTSKKSRRPSPRSRRSNAYSRVSPIASSPSPSALS
jgi:phasin family protein